ncbi:MAG TPA: HD-GYP domain-containing protein [Candidatus Dormibacteraeota bacterium]
MTRRIRLDVYRTAAILVAAAAIVQSMHALAGRPVSAWLCAAMFALGVVALQFPLSMAPREKVSVAAGVFFADLLILGPALATILVAGTQLVSSLISALRRWRMNPRRTSIPFVVVPTIVFNSAQAALSMWAAGTVLAGLGGALGPPDPDRGIRIAVGVVAAALVMVAVNAMLVAGAVALSTGRSAVQVFMLQRRLLPQDVGLCLLGVLAWLLNDLYPWASLLMVIPAWLIYLSLKRTVQLAEETNLAVQKLADMVDRRDPYTYEHSQRVARYAELLARRIGLPPEEVDLVHLAARVHDLGKIGIPDGILQKAGPLTDAERAQMERHPEAGWEILSQFSEYASVRELVLTHHERYDGQGYPRKVVGARLAVVAQVIPVADSLDAMTSARPYRPPMQLEDALGELVRGAGKQWNPDVVAAAVAVFSQEGALAVTLPRPGDRAAPLAPAQS